jgi:hypothetical protein
MRAAGPVGTSWWGRLDSNPGIDAVGCPPPALCVPRQSSKRVTRSRRVETRPKPGSEVPGGEGYPAAAAVSRGTICGGLGYLCGSELEIRAYVGHLDLDGLTLVAGVACQLRWTSLPATNIRIPFFKVWAAFSATARHAAWRS